MWRFKGGTTEGRSGVGKRGEAEVDGTYGLNPPSSIEVRSRIDDALPVVVFVGVVASSSG
jgi:hypothetical protein